MNKGRLLETAFITVFLLKLYFFLYADIRDESLLFDSEGRTSNPDDHFFSFQDSLQPLEISQANVTSSVFHPEQLVQENQSRYDILVIKCFKDFFFAKIIQMNQKSKSTSMQN